MAGTPGEHTTVGGAVVEVRLRFDSKIRSEPVSLQVLGPGGPTALDGTRAVDGTVLSQRLRPLTVPGEYRIVYRVLATDLHPVAGTIPFTYQPGAAPATETAASGAGTGAAPRARTVGYWLSGVGLTVIFVMLLVSRIRRAKS